MARKWNQTEQRAYNHGYDAGELHEPGAKVPVWGFKSKREQAAWQEGFDEAQEANSAEQILERRSQVHAAAASR